MKNSHRSDVQSDRKGIGSRLSRLLSRVGRAMRGRGSDDGLLERLEDRKLLFTLTISPADVNPQTGVGTITQDFGYALPFFFRELPDNLMGPEQVDEFWDDENPQPGQPMVGDPVYIANGSNVRIRNFGNGGAGDIGLAQGGVLAVNLQDLDRFIFDLVEPSNQPNTPPRPRDITLAAFEIQAGLDGNGFNFNETRVDLLDRDGNVVATFTGATLAAANTNPGVNPTIGFFQFGAGGNAFESVRFSIGDGAGQDRFFIDQVSFLAPRGEFADFHEIFGVRAVFSGPAGASVTFLDLYGRDMRRTIALGVPDDAEVALVDLNDDGVPDFNDGIGRVLISGTNSRSFLSLYGGTIEFDQEDGFVFALADGTQGIFDDFEDGGFGYDTDNNNPPNVVGLPAGTGSLVIGSPFVRDNTSQAAYFNNGPGALDFGRDDQGIFMSDNGIIGRISIHGALHGQSQINGAVEQFIVGYLPGSLSISGDAGFIAVASDAGYWVDSDNNVISSDSGIIVGRSAGEIAVGSTCFSDITVLGDVNNVNRRIIDTRLYNEREIVYAFDENQGTEDDVINLVGNATGLQAVYFGAAHYRNDRILSAEYIGSNSGSTRIVGRLGNRDPVNAEDAVDVFAFAATGLTDVVVDLTSTFLDDRIQARIVDVDGLVLASHQTTRFAEVNLSGAAQVTPQGVRMTFRPATSGVYYLVLTAPPEDTTDSATVFYDVVVSGIAPSTLGALRIGAGFGGDLEGNIPTAALSAGNMGLLRIGGGHVTSAVAEAAGNGARVGLIFGDASITVPGNVYGMVFGSDIAGGRIQVGGNVGTFYTGMSPIDGRGPREGDLKSFDLTTGGTIGIFDVRGAIAFDQDGNGFAGPVAIRTGTGASASGDIGEFLVGAFVNGADFSLTTSPGSQIDVMRVGIGVGTDGADGDFDQATPIIRMGTGSDIRFVDFDQRYSGSNSNAFLRVPLNGSLMLTDDGGATVTISVNAGPDAGPSAGSFADIRVLPVDGSQGVAIGRITATLNGGASLNIVSTSAGVVSIGRIITNTNAAGSSIGIFGVGEVDVYQITALGTSLAAITNETTGGDIVAIDAVGVGTITILGGNLGQTQTSGAGRSKIGPFLGIASGMNATVGGALGVTPESINDVWGGEAFVPIDAVDVDNAALEDIGGIFDPYLNGAVIRSGDVASVTVSGAIGDVILQEGSIVTLTANSDAFTLTGGFDGIIGTIYALNLGLIDIGDGVAAPGPSPFPEAGIYADNDIADLVGGRSLNPVIRGAIIAANSVDRDNTAEFIDGIASIRIDGGRVDGAFIGVGNFDAPWFSNRFVRLGEDGPINGREDNGTIDVLRLFQTDLFRSEVFATDVFELSVTQGAFDATIVTARGFITAITADEFRNTTLLGQPLEAKFSRIDVTEDLITLQANVGDIADIVVNVAGRITGSVTGRNITRSDFNVDNGIALINASNDIRNSRIVSGEITSMSAGGDIYYTSLNVPGPIGTITAMGVIDGIEVLSTGPDGSIGTITASGNFFGAVESSGAIEAVISTNGDVTGRIRTTDARDGRLGRVQAGRDVNADIRTDGGVGQIVAGRNVGVFNDPVARRIEIGGSLDAINTPNGTIYQDLRVGGQITGTIRTGRVPNLPGNDQAPTASIVAIGRINAIDWHGDLNGNITSESGGIGSIMITDGSFRAGRRILTRDGSITTVIITGGHLLGDIISEEGIGNVEVRVGADGFTGDAGVNDRLSTFLPFDQFRNQLPPGTTLLPTFQGPRIQAGTNIGLVRVERGNMFETAIYAGNAVIQVNVFGVVRNDNITPGIGGTFIVGGDSVNLVDIGRFAGGLIIAGGVTDLGADSRPGGTGTNTDTVRWGRVGTVFLRGGSGATTVSAGINAGPDGRYNTIDDLVANGRSSIAAVSVTGTPMTTSAFADNGIGPTSPGVVRGGPGLRQAEPGKVVGLVPSSGELSKGVPVAFTTLAGESGTILYNGPGRIFYDRNIGRVAIFNSTLASTVVVTSTTNRLTNFSILSNDGANLGLADVQADLLGNSSFYFDGYVQTLRTKAINSTGTFGAGNDIGSFTTGTFTRGTIDANFITGLIIEGAFGLRNEVGEATIRLLSGNSITVNGALQGLVTIQRNLTTLMVNGIMDRAAVRSGRSISTINATGVRETRISALNDINTVNITGDFFDSLIYAGTDLGSDGAFGGTGAAADRVTDGNIGTVTIAGNFLESDIAAGAARGEDGFLGTGDDRVDEGRSSIGSVTINGTRVGSTFNSESYRIASNGTVGTVTIGGRQITSSGNFAVQTRSTDTSALRVESLRVEEAARLYTAIITFNQEIDFSTFGPALNVSEVRANGITVRLSPSIDYTVEYDRALRAARLIFSRTVTERDLPEVSGLPGPGVYRFDLDAAILRGSTQNNILDGNSDGFVTGSTDDFSQDDIIGDAGDKVTSARVTSGAVTVDFRGAADLNAMLDDNRVASSLPQVNRVFTIRGSLGDHPDHDVNQFRSGGDADVYKITLRAGQILRLGRMGGLADLAERAILSADGTVLHATNGNENNASLQVLPAALPDILDDQIFGAGEESILIKQTGTYYILVTSSVADINIADPTVVTNISPLSGTTGAFNFTLEVFDDGDTGFRGDSNASDGTAVVTAPIPAAFVNGSTSITINGYVFTLNIGGDGVRNTFDDIVSGRSPDGSILSVRTAGNDGVFGTADDRRTSTIDSSIGLADTIGVQADVAPDIDVFHLNNGETIAAGTRIRATLKLTEKGFNLGLSESVIDLGFVQFSLFETTNQTGIGGGRLVAAPSDVSPIGGTPNTTYGEGDYTYGFDANGDFFMQFLAPSSQITSGAASFALYVQGVVRSLYTVEVVTEGSGVIATQPQNILIETRGGTIDWLEAGRGVTTDLARFTTSVVGFSGLVGSQTVDTYVVTRMINQLNAIFQAAGVNVVVSSNPAQFEGQDFSTVFVTGSNEPAAFFQGSFGIADVLFGFEENDNGIFGVSEHSDPFNSDRNDEAVVFLPTLAELGYPPSVGGINAFTSALTAAVGRRIGELVGLRIESEVNSAASPAPIMAVDSVVQFLDTGVYRFVNTTRPLSDGGDVQTDTDFVFGSQNSFALIRRNVALRT